MRVDPRNVINVSNFCDKIFRGFRSTGGQNPHFPIDFAGHRYNSAALLRSLWYSALELSHFTRYINSQLTYYKPDVNESETYGAVSWVVSRWRLVVEFHSQNTPPADHCQRQCSHCVVASLLTTSQLHLYTGKQTAHLYSTPHCKLMTQLFISVNMIRGNSTIQTALNRQQKVPQPQSKSRAAASDNIEWLQSTT